MVDSVEISFRLACTVKQETKRRWVAGCQQLDIFSQGSTKETAKKALDDAVKLWVESCVERDTLDKVLRECGFRRVTPEEAERCSQVIAVRPPAQDDGTAVDTFNLTLTIPAYQAAAALAF